MKHHAQPQPASLAQCLGAAQAEAELMHGHGSVPTWRAGAFDWRPWAAAGVAMSAVAACAVALLWPWEAPPVDHGEGEAVAVAAAPHPTAASAATSSASRVGLAFGASITSPFAGPMGTPAGEPGGASLGQPEGRPGAPTAARLSGESVTSSDCGTDCLTASPSPSPSDPSALLPTARLVAAVPTDLDAWALDPQPYAVPVATPRDVTRPLFNTPVIPDEADPTPGEEVSAEPAAAPTE